MFLKAAAEFPCLGLKSEVTEWSSYSILNLHTAQGLDSSLLPLLVAAQQHRPLHTHSHTLAHFYSCTLFLFLNSVRTGLFPAVRCSSNSFSLVAVTDEDTVKRYYAKFEEKFFQMCEKELAKINTFYSGNTAGSTGFKAHQDFLLSCVFCPYRVSLSPSREAGRGSAAIRHAAERAAVLAGCTEGELSQWAGPEEEEDGVCLVTAGTMQAQEHKGPAAGLLRVLPQPYTAAELSGAHSYSRAKTEETFDY